MTHAVLVYEIRFGSLEYLPVLVVAKDNGEIFDPTDLLVYMAVPEINVDPDVGDWIPAGWDVVNGDYIAKILIGADGDIGPDRGNYDILIKIVDDPEIPLMRAGRLSII